MRSLQTRRVAGCIILHASASRIQALIHSSIPTVFIDKMGQGSHATYVKSDNIDGARQATKHLLALGHRRIAFLTGSTTDLAGLECLLGGQQTLAQAGIAPDGGLGRNARPHARARPRNPLLAADGSARDRLDPRWRQPLSVG